MKTRYDSNGFSYYIRRMSTPSDKTEQKQEQATESVFQKKYDEFVEDLMGALPEYASQITRARALLEKDRLERFQVEVKFNNTMSGGSSEEFRHNPNTVLPGVIISDAVWASLSDQTKKAIWEHVRILSICCFMEAGFGQGDKPKWMDDAMTAAMEEMKKKLESVDFQTLINKLMNMMKPDVEDEKGADAKDATSGAGTPSFDNMFKGGLPKLPERFLKGHMARLAQEMIRDITPEDLGISPEMLKACEKDPSRSIQILFSTFTNNPGIIQQLIGKIGKRLQHKVMTGAINPQEIAREAEELMKEFSENTSFVDMMSGIKSAFGFEDMDMARKAGREGSARLAAARDRLRKKLEKKKAAAAQKK
jgi:hypothetical protein